MNKTLSILLTLVLVCGCSREDRSLEKLVDSVYDRLTLEERAAQLYGIYPGDLLVDGKVSVDKCRELIPYGLGHICQPTSSQDKDVDEIREMVRDIQDYLMNETHAGIPAMFQEEALTGLTAKGATAYPQAIGDEFAALFAGDLSVHQQFAGIDAVQLGRFFLQRQPVVHGIHQFFQGTVFLPAAAGQ